MFRKDWMVPVLEATSGGAVLGAGSLFFPQMLSSPILKLSWQASLLFFPWCQDCSFQVDFNPFLFPTYSFPA